MTKSEIARVVADLHAIAEYARKAQELLGETKIGTNLDQASMRLTWTRQAVKSALHTINRV